MELNHSNLLQASILQSPIQRGVVSSQALSAPADQAGAPTQSAGSDTVSLSPEGKEKSRSYKDVETSPQSSSDKTNELDQEEVAELTELKQRDVEVRAHEQAHLSAAGGYATGGASFTYQKGPDGQTYAVGGEVGIDMSAENDPNATIQKMQTIKRAALAPASPSSTDRQVAAQATVKETQARQELLKEQQEELLQAEKSSDSPVASARYDDYQNNNPVSVSSLKASIQAYEQMSAL
ncbi:putative metalloprotease CJM1_0395 family protein [Desulforhopalus sp. IMCC35007]|uniref:putative metalloprotease CJM1_0395 family protein n=1 Tax=Desulforhopalus sp. IMCC35007 TaxID=2569543 RepID=UPI0010AEDA93|nr:putative metalloprotease CJM1_0395 family protein [Desulforhopalus sp. IMCC35007]TKB10352.1 catalase [Desulforhopalus sp. IMCC35007]